MISSASGPSMTAERRHRQIASQRERRGAVLEDAVVRPLGAHQSIGEHGEAPMIASDDRVRVGERCSLEPKVQGDISAVHFK